MPLDTSDADRTYQNFCNAISTAAKKYIPRGRRNDHIPCWDAECENLYQMFLQSPEECDSSRAASALLSRLDRKRRDRWSEAVQTIDFSHSSRKAWSILNNLPGRSRRSPRHCAVSANTIASVLVNNGKYEHIDRKSSRLVSQEVSDLWRASTTSAVNVCGSFTPSEFAAALRHLKPGKAPGPDSICPELLLHAEAALKSWLCGFLSSCLHHLKLPKIWRRALVVAIPKPMKRVEDPRAIAPSLCSVSPTRSSRGSFTPVSSPLSTRDSFETKKKAGAVFVDLTAAYDTVWHRGLTCKLLRLLPDKHMVQMIMELIRNRSFTLSIGDSKQSRL